MMMGKAQNMTQKQRIKSLHKTPLTEMWDLVAIRDVSLEDALN